MAAGIDEPLGRQDPPPIYVTPPRYVGGMNTTPVDHGIEALKTLDAARFQYTILCSGPPNSDARNLMLPCRCPVWGLSVAA